MTEPKPYFLFTHTPLHVGAGHSVGYVDLPIQREAHTRIPIVPGSSLKGVLRDRDEFDEATKAWLFGKGAGEADGGAAGALLIGEARVLAFPVRSAKGSFAWITCPLALRRAKRDGVLGDQADPSNPSDDQALLPEKSLLALGDKVVLEEYTFTRADDLPPGLGAALQALLPEDPVWAEVASRLVILSDGMMSFFVQSACEIAQHVAIADETGTAKEGALFNQENCPSETLFYGVIAAQKINGKPAEDAVNRLAELNGRPLQIGGSETTGLGWCTFIFNPAAK